jgi:hypothetical protein
MFDNYPAAERDRNNTGEHVSLRIKKIQNTAAAQATVRQATGQIPFGHNGLSVISLSL